MLLTELVAAFTMLKPLRDKFLKEAESSFDWLTRKVPKLCTPSNGLSMQLFALHMENDGVWSSGGAIDMDSTGIGAWWMQTEVGRIRFPAYAHQLSASESTIRRFNHLLSYALRSNLQGPLWPRGDRRDASAELLGHPRGCYTCFGAAAPIFRISPASVPMYQSSWLRQ
jgi:hypothetical protein